MTAAPAVREARLTEALNTSLSLGYILKYRMTCIATTPERLQRNHVLSTYGQQRRMWRTHNAPMRLPIITAPSVGFKPGYCDGPDRISIPIMFMLASCEKGREGGRKRSVREATSNRDEVVEQLGGKGLPHPERSHIYRRDFAAVRGLTRCGVDRGCLKRLGVVSPILI